MILSASRSVCSDVNTTLVLEGRLLSLSAILLGSDTGIMIVFVPSTTLIGLPIAASAVDFRFYCLALETITLAS
jgi:hypothetical protein